MTVRHRVDRDRALILVTLEGAVTVEEYRAFLDALADEGPGPWSWMVDTTNLAAHLPTARVREVAEMLVGAAPRLGVRKLAIVAPKDVTFGQSRMFEAFTAPGPVAIHVARDTDGAIAWLTGG